jgi:hypothetical protein
MILDRLQSPSLRPCVTSAVAVADHVHRHPTLGWHDRDSVEGLAEHPEFAGRQRWPHERLRRRRYLIFTILMWMASTDVDRSTSGVKKPPPETEVS